MRNITLSADEIAKISEKIAALEFILESSILYPKEDDRLQKVKDMAKSNVNVAAYYKFPDDKLQSMLLELEKQKTLLLTTAESSIPSKPGESK